MPAACNTEAVVARTTATAIQQDVKTCQDCLGRLPCIFGDVLCTHVISHSRAYLRCIQAMANHLAVLDIFRQVAHPAAAQVQHHRPCAQPVTVLSAATVTCSALLCNNTQRGRLQQFPRTLWNALAVKLCDLCQEAIVHVLDNAGECVEVPVICLVELQALCKILSTVQQLSTVQGVFAGLRLSLGWRSNALRERGIRAVCHQS